MDEAELVIAGRYEVVTELGRGALGVVYKVHDREKDVYVGLKLLKEELSDPVVRGRFQREFKSISDISHPNIVEVYDVGDHEGRPYFTMELLRGADLAIYTQAYRPPSGADGFEQYASAVAYIFHQVADCLATCHELEIIHRDLKPENIFVYPSKYPRAKLLDFGHARQDDQQNLTATGTVLGTAYYIPPEQATGKEPTPYADLYSMGCVLFETLTGRPPFNHAGIMQLLMAHIREPAPDARTMDSRVPEPLAQICLELMEKQPEKRPANAKIVADRLSLM